MGKAKGSSWERKDKDMEGARGSMGVKDRLRLIWPKDITEDFVNVIKTTGGI